MIEFIGDPVATASQHEQELAALELTRHPTVQAAYRDVAEKWLSRARASQAMRERFDDAFTEVMFSAAIWSSNQDKLRPKVSCITRLSHPVAGRQIPGSRWGIDNPDSVYRVIPIAGDERYEIHGRVGTHRMTENYFTLWNADMGTVAVLKASYGFIKCCEREADVFFHFSAVQADMEGVEIGQDMEFTVQAESRNSSKPVAVDVRLAPKGSAVFETTEDE